MIKTMKTIAILNGPNLDRLGLREPEIYGHQTLSDLEQLLKVTAQELKVQVSCFQSNHEGQLIDRINQLAAAEITGLIINPAAYTHTSLALRDAIAGSGIPSIEVHISNLYRREAVRHHSMTADACVGVISGLGFEGYVAALRYLAG
jgi:3-dehydroquinate dehydratase-2